MKRYFSFNLSKETDATIAILCFLICYLFGQYSKNIYGYHWFDKFTKSTPFILVGLIVFQLFTFFTAIKKLDYVLFFQKLTVTFLIATTVVCIYYFPTVYNNRQFASKQKEVKYQRVIQLDLPDDFRRRFQQFVSFEFNNQKQLLHITERESKKLKEGAKYGIEYCIELSIKIGLDSTYVLSNYTLYSCK